MTEEMPWTGRPDAKANGDGVLLSVHSECVSVDMTKQEAIDLAVDLIAAATGYEAVNTDGEYLVRTALPGRKRIDFVSVERVARGLPPEARAIYLKSRGR